MKKIALLFILLGFSFIASTQTLDIDGTFQLMTTNEKAKEVFTTDIYSIVENNREINKVVIVKIGEYTWVRILSLNTINSPNFTPLPSGIVAIDEKDPFLINSESNNSNK